MTTKGFGYERAPRVSTSDQADSGPTRTEDHLNLFKHVVESSTDAIGISTPDGLHWYQNAAFDALFGDIGGDPPATLYCDETTGREVFDTIMGGGEWSGEVQMYAADDRWLDRTHPSRGPSTISRRCRGAPYGHAGYLLPVSSKAQERHLALLA